MNSTEQISPQDIDRIIVKHRGQRGDLIAILDDIQTKYRYLSEDALRIVAERTNRPLVDVYGVATFYKQFSLTPRGKHLVSTCLGTACHVRGAPEVATEFERQLGIPAGETTRDREFTLKTVNCLGACALGPIAVVDGHYFSCVRKIDVGGIIEKSRSGLDRVDVASDRRVFPLVVRCLHCNHGLMDADYPIDNHPSIKLTASFADKHGWIRLSSLYGSYSFVSEYEIPADTVVHFFCPHCHSEIVGASNCPDCGEPMVPMGVSGGGIVQICTRRDCRGHILDLAYNTID